MIAESKIIDKPARRLNPFQGNLLQSAKEGFVSGLSMPNQQQNSETETAVKNEPEWILLDGSKPPLRTLDTSNEVDVYGSSFIKLYERQVEDKEDLSKLKRIVRREKASLDEDRFRLLQKWEGKVTLVENGCFVAELTNLTESTLNEEVEIEIEEVAPDDRDLIIVGSSFYWSIGYLQKSHGQQIRASEIRFKRIPGWTEYEILKAEKSADAFRSLFTDLDCAQSEA